MTKASKKVIVGMLKQLPPDKWMWNIDEWATIDRRIYVRHAFPFHYRVRIYSLNSSTTSKRDIQFWSWELSRIFKKIRKHHKEWNKREGEREFMDEFSKWIVLEGGNIDAPKEA